MPFFAVLLVEVHETFRLLTDEQYRGDLYLITTAESPYVHEWTNSQLVCAGHGRLDGTVRGA